ncbi:MAG: helix-turn-helix transcriptional regulator [Pseudonocardiaceae bacterium]
MLVRSAELAMAAGRLSWMSQSLALLAFFDACRGHLASARTRWARAAASSPHGDPMIVGCGAFIELLTGDLAMVATYVHQAQGHDPAARSRLPARLAARAAMAEAERGHLAEARRHLETVTVTGVSAPWYWWAAGTVARVEGRWATATTALQRAVDGCAAMSLWALAGFVLADLAEVAVTAGDSDAAAKAAISARDSAGRSGAPIGQALHQFATAWALIGRGHHDHAARAALRAIDGFGSHGYALWAARARIAYAVAARRAHPRAAGDAVREAVAAFDACGAAPRCEQARTLLHQLGSAQVGPAPVGPAPVGSAQVGSGDRCTTAVTRGPGALTGRERQVAELAASGYTAPQIATQLHIGVRTVETHLARSYPKLGITSKQQLVHRAAEFGFTPGP